MGLPPHIFDKNPGFVKHLEAEILEMGNIDVLHWIIKVDLIHDFTKSAQLYETGAIVENDFEESARQIWSMNNKNLQVTLNIYWLRQICFVVLPTHQLT